MLIQLFALVDVLLSSTSYAYKQRFPPKFLQDIVSEGIIRVLIKWGWQKCNKSQIKYENILILKCNMSLCKTDLCNYKKYRFFKKQIIKIFVWESIQNT